MVDIPPGTAARIASGELSGPAPHRIEMVLGVHDVLVIHNQDSEWHQVGPYAILPGHTLVTRYYRPGTIV